MIDGFIVGFLGIFKLILIVIKSPELYRLLGMSIGIIVSAVALCIIFIIIGALLDVISLKIR